MLLAHSMDPDPKAEKAVDALSKIKNALPPNYQGNFRPAAQVFNLCFAKNRLFFVKKRIPVSQSQTGKTQNRLQPAGILPASVLSL